jgi:hypothetical protein
MSRLTQFLTVSDDKSIKKRRIFWLSLSLTFSAIYALLGLREAFASEYVVQDDARQHVFWMMRFLDADLFPNNPIADYFESVAPAGYKAVYQIPAMLGINPLLLNKLFPMFLGLITTGYCFGVAMQLLPIPATGFMATLLFNQNLWMKDDLASGTPRAFLFPFFLAFLYYLLRRNVWGVAGAIALLGLFYPHYMLVASVILFLRLFDWENRRLRLSQNRTDLMLGAVGLIVAFVVLLPYALSSSRFGPTITAAQARLLPDFLPEGRTQFFDDNPWMFWLNGRRSGFFPRFFFAPATLWLGMLLPFLMQFSAKFPLARQVKNQVLFWQILLAALVMFFAAHILVFRLHVPSRYTGHNLRIILSFATAIALTLVLEFLCRNARNNRLLLVPAGFLVAALILYPIFVPEFPLTNYEVGKVPGLYEFFQKQPKDIAIASLAEEANNLPSFSQRSILTGRKYAVPYQVGYYNQFIQQTNDVIRAQYSPNLAELKDFHQKYSVDFWLLERTAFMPDYVANNEWIGLYQPAATETVEKLKQGTIPVLTKFMDKCKVFEVKNLVVLQAECINR